MGFSPRTEANKVGIEGAVQGYLRFEKSSIRGGLWTAGLWFRCKSEERVKTVELVLVKREERRRKTRERGERS